MSGEGPPSGGADAGKVVPLTAAQLQEYLVPVASAVLQRPAAELSSAFSADPEAAAADGIGAVERFVAENPPSSAGGSLFLFHDDAKGRWALSIEARHVATATHPTFALVKNTDAALQAGRPLATATSFLVLAPGSAFDPFLRSMTNVFEPLLSAEVESKPKERREKAEVMQSVQDLLANLTNQSSMKIPQVDLSKHVNEAVKKKVDSFPDLKHPQLTDKIAVEKQNADGKAWDAVFSQEVYRSYQLCTKDVRSVVDMREKREASPLLNAREEIKFWNDLHDTLADVEKQLNKKAWSIQIEILRRSNRLFIRGVTDWAQECGVQDCMAIVKEYKQLFEELPLSKLHQARSIDQMTEAVQALYQYLNKHVKTAKYPITRMIALIDAITRDFNKQLLKILSLGLLDMSYDQFHQLTDGCDTLFSLWTTNYRRFTDSAKAAARRQTGKSVNVGRVQMDHLPLKQRVEQVAIFRRGHEKFVKVLQEVMPTGEEQSWKRAEEDMRVAYELVSDQMKNRLLDVTDDGAILWESAKAKYEEKATGVESAITTELVRRLEEATTASEMFRVFSKFNPLTTNRPKVRDAIQCYQASLIAKVEKDMSALKEKYADEKDRGSGAMTMSKLHDMPTVSSTIIWSRAIERQLQTYMKRVEDVYGRGWHRLKSLRKKPEGGMQAYWVLDEHLADFVNGNDAGGVRTLEKHARDALSTSWIRTAEQAQGPNQRELELRAMGTAIALAFLQIAFADSKSDWEPVFEEGKESLTRLEKQLQVDGTFTAMCNLLKQVTTAQHHRAGAQLRTEGEAFRAQINANIATRVQRWNEQVYEKICSAWSIFQFSEPEPSGDGDAADRGKKRVVHVTGPVFKVVKGADDQHLLEVNFHPEIVQLINEMHAMRWLNMVMSVRYEVAETAVAANDMYPYASVLWEAVKLFQRDMRSVGGSKVHTMLLAKEVQAVYKNVQSGLRMNWEQELELNKISKYSQVLHVSVADLHRRLASLSAKLRCVDDACETLEKCDPNAEAFRAALADTQKVIDDLNFAKFSNIGGWVAELDTRVEQILAARLVDLLQSWTYEFNRLGQSEEAPDDLADETTKPRRRRRAHFHMAPLEVSIRIQNRVMLLNPSVENARAEWSRRLQAVVGWVVRLRRLQANRYDTQADPEPAGPELDLSKTYGSVLHLIDRQALYSAFNAIDRRCEEAERYFDNWVKFQALWEMELDRIVVLCGDDLGRWLSLLGDIRQSKNMMDSSETRKSFGAIEVCYQNVQEKVSKKYDETNRKLLDRFMGLLGGKMAEFYKNVHEERRQLESMDFTADSNNMVKFLTRLPDIDKKRPLWAVEIDQLGRGEKMLRKQIRQSEFTKGWKWHDQLQGEWGSFNAALETRKKEILQKRERLQQFVLEQDSRCEEEFQQLKETWNQKKPVQGCKPTEAINTITMFKGQMDALKQQFHEICQAKEALSMEVRDVGKMNALAEDIGALRDVWDKLEDVHQAIGKLGDTPWKAVNHRAVSSQLREVEARLKNFPSNIRTYTAFADLTQRVEGLLKINPIIGDLCSEAIKERHWVQIVQVVHADGFENVDNLTLGQVWACDLVKYQKSFENVIQQAQGEMALEVFLGKLKKTWPEMELKGEEYQKVWLVNNWEDLSEKLSGHLVSLEEMQRSRFYKAFEEEAKVWDTKLRALQDLVNTSTPEGKWYEVQRKWVYLEGVFLGNEDIQRRLPTEHQDFQRVDSEFRALQKKVRKRPYALEVLQIAGVREKFEAILSRLRMIQKKLGDYLEQQRQTFPRFYFVGDEDLLEIIGHSKEPQVAQKHFKKMFAGIMMLVLDETQVGEEPRILGMKSFEGEIVHFHKPIDLAEVTSVNLWLKACEDSMQAVLRSEAKTAFDEFSKFSRDPEDAIGGWIDRHPAQILELAVATEWTRLVEEQLRGLSGQRNVGEVRQVCIKLLSVLAQRVVTGKGAIERKKMEHLITSLVYQRDATGRLADRGIADVNDFDWLVKMRYYSRQGEAVVEIANASLPYSYEYLGVSERLVQTPLTDKCYLTLTQALHTRMGGAPSGPAGTGKTETVKALGTVLGRFVLVFCCDEAFNMVAMGRIFCGLCQVGAWGCFDEFNRLEERILSAVSQQIQVIQQGLAAGRPTISLLDKEIPMHNNVGIFITMNPGYAGRSELPDNLKQLFRPIAMAAPDREIIAEVMLFSQGFQVAEVLAKKIVPLFQLCKDQLSQQGHYDFGLRALKSTLVNAGNMKRSEHGTAVLAPEEEHMLLLKSITKTIEPKLVAEDVALFHSLTADVFPGVQLPQQGLETLIGHIKDVCGELSLLCEDDSMWLQKVLQLHQIQAIHHGLMLVGPSCSGKTMAWTVLLIAMARMEGKEGIPHVIDPKALSKAELYGFLDKTTGRTWTDGVFTNILREIVDSTSPEEKNRLHWIIFDGDVDPEWVENLNALLDDNRLLTLPNGERLQLPPNVRVMFEVQDLKYATLATVSRCGMVWFSEDVCSVPMMLHHYIHTIDKKPLEAFMRPIEVLKRTSAYEKSRETDKMGTQSNEDTESQKAYFAALRPHFAAGAVVDRAVQEAMALLREATIMEWDTAQYLGGLCSLINKGCQDIFDAAGDKPEGQVMQQYAVRRLVMSLAWSLGGACNFRRRLEFCNALNAIIRDAGLGEHLPPGDLLDFEVGAEGYWGEWLPWSNRVLQVDIPSEKVGKNDVIIATVDTVRHEEVVLSWLQAHRPMLFCGPPGSGKTMTLTSVLKRLTDYEPVFLNFSSGSTPQMILKTFEHPSFTRVNNNIIRPANPGKWIVIFCDECNLPATDNYGTQRVISLMRQMVERGGFWEIGEKQPHWVTLERIQFAGACNPPTDPGRVPLSHRFLRFAPLLFVDFPSRPSLEAIYGTFCRGLLGQVQHLKQFGDQLARAMVQFYESSQRRFTPDIEAHYVYSPRELSRWTSSVKEGIQALSYTSRQAMGVNELVRLSIHEGLRLFRDRLIRDNEKEWTDEEIDRAFTEHFPEMDAATACARPMRFSKFLGNEYVDNDQEELREHVRGKLKTFAEEEMDVQLVVFDSVLDHILRIDRIVRQPLGHMLLVGVAGAGKTVLSKFVAWRASMKIFQIKAHRKYTIIDFENDLRTVLKRTGCAGEEICFIFDESNVMDSGFLEYMNALLASGEVPGLFEGAERTKLIQEAVKGLQSGIDPEAGNVDASDEHQVYKWFVNGVQRRLHVIFTMNPNSPDFHNRCQTSPALFNRCVIDWFGEWSDSALRQVAGEFTEALDIMESQDKAKPQFPTLEEAQGALVTSIVGMHQRINLINDKLRRKGAGRGTFITPRHYLDFIKQFKRLYKEKREEVLMQQMHLNQGLSALDNTTSEVNRLKKELEEKDVRLQKVQIEVDESMNRLVADKSAANEEQRKAEVMEKDLQKEQKLIDEDKAKAEEDLSAAKPGLEAAKSAVSSIDDKDIREVRTYANPPVVAQKVMEMVATLLGKKAKDWKTIREMMSQRTFLQDVVSFESSKITKQAVEAVQKMLQEPKFTQEAAHKASKALGPLFEWSAAQLEYARILTRIQPLTAKIAQLEKAQEEKAAALAETRERLKELEASVQRMQVEFGRREGEKQKLGIERTETATKCERSQKLLGSLSSEASRWADDKKTFSKQITTVVGDCLLASGFLAYNGYFDDYHRRQVIVPAWQKELKETRVLFKKHLSLQEYLSKPEDRLGWQKDGLPPDELYVENAVILSRYQRYPLLIDPSGTAVSFLMTHFKDKSIAKTSFLEDGFVQKLKNALMRGCPMLVQDVESIDPIMNPILNNEITKQGGRAVLRLGEEDADISPDFKLFLSTRDPTFQFAPDLCGRVTFANFTVTPGSLTSQCLHHTLKAERPDIDKQRTEMIKAQGEYQERQRSLERQLLEEISKAKGNILENDTLIKQLEVLKNTTTEVKEKLEKTDETMEQIKKVEKQFRTIADGASKLYFMLKQLPDLNRLYQFSLAHFMDILTGVLEDKNSLLPPNEKANKTSDARRNMILRQLFVETYEWVTRGMLQTDHLTIGLRFCQVRLSLKGEKTELIPQDLWDFLVSTGHGKRPSPTGAELGLEPKYQELLDEVMALPSMEDARDSIERNGRAWASLLKAPHPLESLPDYAQGGLHPVTLAMKNLLLMKVFRPDCLSGAVRALVRQVFDHGFDEAEAKAPVKSIFAPNEPSLASISDLADAFTPLLLCSAPGFDASDRVQDLAKQCKKKLTEIAMGSPSGYQEADKALHRGLSEGSWLILKNVHISSQYLAKLEKMLHSAQLEKKSNPAFRLFLTSEISPKLSTNLLVRSHVLVFEPSNGMQPSLLRSMEKHKSRMAIVGETKGPKELPRLHFMAAWLHAVVVERLRYAPLGWAKKYEFSESDFIRAIETIDQWVVKVSEGRSNVDPKTLPWKALFSLLGESVYGGRIDNDFDQELMRSFLQRFFVPTCYNSGFTLTNEREGERALTTAAGHDRKDFEEWVLAMPDEQTPVWLGLPNESQKMVQQQQGEQMLVDLVKITDIFAGDGEGEDEENQDPSSPRTKDGAFVPEWARRLLGSVEGWLEEIIDIPEHKVHQRLRDAAPPAGERPNPIVQALKREVGEARRLFRTVKKELDTIAAVCRGEVKPTNTEREVMSQLSKGAVPARWAERYVTPPGMAAGQWFADFGRRCENLARVGAADPAEYCALEWNLGLLLYPGAFITATRQHVARSLEYPLERLRLSLDVSEDNARGAFADANGGSFILTGLGLQSSQLQNGVVSLVQGRLQSPMGVHRLWWKKDEAHKLPPNTLTVPLYLNPSRTQLLAKLNLPADPAVEAHEWYQLGIAVTAWQPA